MGALSEHWNGSTGAAVQHRVVFGSNGSSLTAGQLAQIQFRNPDGVNGFVAARILATGEVVPADTAPQLTSSRSGNGLSLSWGPGWLLQSSTNAGGPYQDVPNAASPYTVNFARPQEFFRLRQ